MSVNSQSRKPVVSFRLAPEIITALHVMAWYRRRTKAQIVQDFLGNRISGLQEMCSHAAVIDEGQYAGYCGNCGNRVADGN